MNFPTSERLIFSPLDSTRLYDLFELDRDPEVTHFLTRKISTLEEAQNKLDDYLRYAKAQNGLGSYAVLRKSNRQFLGLGFLVNIELNTANDVEVGYRLRKEFWGQGFATEIATALLNFGFQELKLPAIYGTTHNDHVVSQHVLQKVGLSPMGSAPFYDGCKIFKRERS